MRQRILGFHTDDVGDWVADLSCGHRQHVRHRPPFQVRPWVLQADGRDARVGSLMECPLCDRGEPPAVPPTGDGGEGGESACFAHLVCPDCGAVMEAGHRHGEGSGLPS